MAGNGRKTGPETIVWRAASPPPLASRARRSSSLSAFKYQGATDSIQSSQNLIAVNCICEPERHNQQRDSLIHNLVTPLSPNAFIFRLPDRRWGRLFVITVVQMQPCPPSPPLPPVWSLSIIYGFTICECECVWLTILVLHVRFMIGCWFTTVHPAGSGKCSIHEAVRMFLCPPAQRWNSDSDGCMWKYTTPCWETLPGVSWPQQTFWNI